MDLSFDAQTELVEQLQRSVHQLVAAALARARHATEPALSPPAATLAALSPREREVLGLVAAGHSNKAIARALALSPHTVKRHVANILDKLGARTRVQAVARCQGLQGRPWLAH